MATRSTHEIVQYTKEAEWSEIRATLLVYFSDDDLNPEEYIQGFNCESTENAVDRLRYCSTLWGWVGHMDRLMGMAAMHEVGE